MRLLILHLADMHIAGDDDPAATKVEPITAAVMNLETDLDMAVVVVAGDLADGGREGQYIGVAAFLEELSRSLSKRLPARPDSQAPDVHVVVVPGNHDCDLSGSQEARRMLVEGALEKPELAGDNSFVETCTSPQKWFFEFQSAFFSEGLLSTSAARNSKLAYEYSFAFGEEEIRFICCNTAWLSQMHERPGSLFFPCEAIPSDGSHATLVVSVFHHPCGWLEPDNKREFRRIVESASDFILTGHEHDSELRRQESSMGMRNVCVEGDAIKPRDLGSGGFNALIIDTQKKEYRFLHFTWGKGMYARAEGTDAEWREYPLGRLRQTERFRISDEMNSWLDDPGANLTHRKCGRLKLADVFLFPDLREVAVLPGEEERTVRSHAVIDMVEHEPFLLLTGDDQSGKTSLAKMLFRVLRGRGDVPVFLDASRGIETGDRLQRQIEKEFRRQYSPGALEDYRQLDRSRRTLIIDDYHRLRTKAQHRHELLSELPRHSGRLILLANNLEQAVLDIMFPQGSAGAGGTFRHFRVLPFGHELRDRLAEKWLMLGGYSRNSAPEFVYRLDQVTRSLDTLIGKNYVPAYPIFVLSVLQAAEAMTPLDTRASTHGYFYELLIKEALARDATEQQYSDAAGYLTHVASAFLVRGLHEADSDEMKTIHRGYEEEYDIQLSFGDMMQHLIDRHILVRYEGAYTFRYRFIYYFFVASHIRDHLHEPVVRETVSKFCRELHGEEQANVLLFLAHLSRDPFIVGEMLKAAKALYPEVPPVQLADDVEFLDNLGDTSDDIIFQDGEVTERRRRLLEAMDSTDAATVVDDTEDGSRDSDENGSAAMSSLNAALKTTQILGQMLKNFPATMKGSVKLELAQTCCSLGLRALGAILSIFRENLSPILADFTAIISERHPDLGEADLRSRARRLMLALSEIACFGFIKHISASVGAPRLAQTYARLVTDGSPPSARLVDTSIALDHSGEFPTGKLKKLAKELEPRFLARRVLQYLTVHHFCVFPVDYKTKMSVCKALGISYKPVRVPRPAQRLVSR